MNNEEADKLVGKLIGSRQAADTIIKTNHTV
jgi:hypothetical protein